MTALKSLLVLLDDHLGQAPKRLLQTIADLGTTADDGTITADEMAVLSRLREIERSTVTADTVHQRIGQINIAAADLAQAQGNARRSVTVSSVQTRIIVTLDEHAILRGGVMAATKAEADKADPSQLEQPRAALPDHLVMISHAWESDAVEKILDDFVAELGRKCRALPEAWRDKFTVKLWFDRRNMHGQSHTFQDQTDQACQSARLALFMLSDHWYVSDNCKKEARFFQEADPCRFLRIQLSGSSDQGDRDYTQGPIFPEHWRRDCGNLLKAAELGTAKWDDFVTHIRNAICTALDRLPPLAPTHQPSARDKMRAATRAWDHDHAVREGSTETPHYTRSEDGETAQPILPLLMDWACSDTETNRVFALLGSFGAGKTTTAQLFARQLADAPGTGDSPPPMPVYLDFRRLIPAYDREAPATLPLPDLIGLALAGGMNGQEVVGLLQAEPCVIIFDGLDEVGTRIGPERAAALYRNLLEIVPASIWTQDRKQGRADWTACPIRILVTCRTHFFRDGIEENSTLCAHDRHDTGPRREADSMVRRLYMAPFTPDQIRSLLQKSLGEQAGEQAFRTIETIHDLAGLAQKPIMTRYIAELMPDLTQDQAQGRPIDAARLYHHLFRRALERDGDKRPLMTPGDRQTLLESLAHHLWQHQRPALTADDLAVWFDAHVTEHPGLRMIMSSRLDARTLLHTELRNANLLIREHDDAFRFVHTSFQEYFLARALRSRLSDPALDRSQDMPPISRETISFLLDMIGGDGDWSSWETAIDRLIMPDASPTIRALSIHIRLAMGERGRPIRLPPGADLSGLDLRSIRLGAVHGPALRLDRIDFRQTGLNRAVFSNIHFHQCRFDDAILSQSRFVTCLFHDCSGHPLIAADCRALDCRDNSAESWLARHIPFAFTGGPHTITIPHPGPACHVSLGHGAGDATFSPDGRFILTGSGEDHTARLWDAASGAQIGVYRGHHGAVTSAVFSPDGKTVLTASQDHTARLWDTASGAQIALYRGHDEELISAVFAPDGRFILTASWDGTARLWDAASGDQIALYQGHGEELTSAVFAPDGRTILTASMDHTARLWDRSNGTQMHVYQGHNHPVRMALFSPDGSTILTTAHKEYTAQLWDAVGGTQIALLQGHDKPISRAMFSPDGRFILTASFDNTARLWDSVSGAQIMEFRGHTDTVLDAAFSPDGRHILTTSWDRTARLWDAVSGAQITQCRGHDGPVTHGTFSPDGRTILTTAWDDTIRLWHVDGGDEIASCQTHAPTLGNAVFSPDGRTILTAGGDSCARLWDTASGSQIRLYRGYDQPLHHAIFSPDGRFILTIDADNTPRLWNAASATQIAHYRGHEHPVTSAIFSPDGRLILTASHDNTARLWDSASGTQIALCQGHASTLLSAVLSPDGRFILTASHDNTARLWDSANGTQIALYRGHEGSVHTAIFSPDDRTILTASWDGTACLWDRASGTQITLYQGHEATVNTATFSPDGRTILTASNDNTARLWDRDSGSQIALYQGHEGSVRTAIFSPDGHSILTASRDGTARLWDKISRAQIMVYRGHDGPVATAEFSPDGRFILTASDDRTVRLWDTASGRPHFAVAGLPDQSWCVLNDDMSVRRIGPDGWNYLYGLERGADGWPVVVRPDLPPAP